MDEFKSFFENYEKFNQARADQELIAAHISAALHPFKPGEITIKFSNNYEGWGRKFWVSVANLPTEVSMVALEEIDSYLIDRETYLSEVAERVASYFKHLPYITPDPSFILGEN